MLSKITDIGDLINDKYYWLVSKLVYDNGEHSKSKMIQKFRDHGDTPAYFGDRIWCYEDNNQAMENYDIYGPIPEPCDVGIMENYSDQHFTVSKIYDLGVNFNGYPLEDMHSQLYDDILETIPLAGRERKNIRYKVILMQEV